MPLSPTGHAGLFAPAAAALATSAVSGYRLGSREVWQDELATWWAATLPWSAFWRLLRNVDLVHTPYYLWMRLWTSLAGVSAVALRLPSVIGMAICAALIVVLGGRLLGARAGLWAGLLFAPIPSILRYGQEARPYAFTLVATTLSVLLLVRALEAPARRGRWLAYSASLFAVGALHMIALSNLAAHALFVVPREPPRRLSRHPALRAWVLSVCVALAMLAPLLWLATLQSEQIGWTARLSASLADLPKLLFRGRPIGIALMLMAALALVRPDRTRLALATWALLPPLLAWLTHSSVHLFVHRYLLFTVPAYCLLAGYALETSVSWLSRKLDAGWLGSVAPAGALLLLFGMASRAYPGIRDGRDVGGKPYRLASTQLLERAREGDAVAFGGGPGAYWTRLGLIYHAHGRPIPREPFLLRSPEESGHYRPEECPDAAACLPADVRRLWILTSASPTDLFAGMPSSRAGLLRTRFDVESVVPCGKMTIALLVARPAG